MKTHTKAALALAAFTGAVLLTYAAVQQGVSYDAATHVVAQTDLSQTFSNITVSGTSATFSDTRGITISPGGLRVFSQITNDSLNVDSLVLTGPQRQLGSVAPGSAGQVMTSAGPGVAPSFQDGTAGNWVASGLTDSILAGTATASQYVATNSAGNAGVLSLTSKDGTYTSTLSTTNTTGALVINAATPLSASDSKLAALSNGGTNRLTADYLGNIHVGPTIDSEYDPSTDYILESLRFTGGGEPGVTGIYMENADSGSFAADAWTDYRVSTTSTTEATGTFYLKSQTADGTAAVQMDAGSNSGTHTPQVRVTGLFGSLGFNLEPTIDATSTPYSFDTALTHTSGNLAAFSNHGTNMLALDYDGQLTLTRHGTGTALYGVSAGGNAQLGSGSGVLVIDALTSSKSIIPTIDNTYNLAGPSSSTWWADIGWKGKAYASGFLNGVNYSRVAVNHSGTNGFATLDSQASGTAGGARPFRFQSNSVTTIDFTLATNRDALIMGASSAQFQKPNLFMGSNGQIYLYRSSLGDTSGGLKEVLLAPGNDINEFSALSQPEFIEDGVQQVSANSGQTFRTMFIANSGFADSITKGDTLNLSGGNLSYAFTLNRFLVGNLWEQSDTNLLYSTDTTVNGTNKIVQLQNNKTDEWVLYGGGSVKQRFVANPEVASTLSSGTTITPTRPVHFVSGTTTIDTITAPHPISLTGGQITLIPTGLWATSTSGNVALATSAVVNKALILTYDQATAKWYPSY